VCASTGLVAIQNISDEWKIAMIRCVRLFVLVVAFTVFGMSPAVSQIASPSPASKFPTRPIKLIVTYSPGGGNDIIARLFAQKLSAAMGQPLVVENHPGGGGMIGTALAAHAAPDGYTILLVSTPFVMAPTLFPKLPYDTLKDFAPITMIGSVQNMLVVNPSVPAKSVADLLTLARAKSSALSAATLGNATTQHLAAAMLNYMGKTDILLVPYKGSAPGMNDLLAGHVQMMFNAMPSTLPYVKGGQLRALAVTGAARSPMAPDLPTVAETLPGFEIVTWYGVLAPAGTPPDIVARFNSEFLKASQLPDMKKKLAEMGVDIKLSSSDTFGALIKSEMRKWEEVIRLTKVTAD
jgi:tripartite-type tricarboxylate transporter receptor subunit TctC